uniref:Angiotensin-converting enzyme n=1 Tax=Megaselia scalaris TaxID=36166 RepID=T1GU10_MEGSC
FKNDFWKNRVKAEDEEQGDCKSDIFDITPHVYLKYCKKVDFRKFLQAHGYMGSIHYALQKKELPFYYFSSYDLEYPVGEAVILSASTHKHLKSVGLLPDVKYKDDVMMNRLFRMVSLGAPKTEIDAKNFLGKASDKLFNLYDTIATEVYTSSDNDEDFESLFQKLTVVQTISNEVVEVAEEAKKYDLTLIKDPKIKNALKRLRKSASYFVLGEEYFNNLLLSSNALKELSTDKDIEPYQNSVFETDEEGYAYFPDITRIYAKSQDPKELQYYWESWRDKNQVWSNIHFSNIVESIQKSANLTDMGILDFWFEIYENPNFLDEMEAIMKQLNHFTFNCTLLSDINYIINVVIDKTGPIPEHLFQQVLVQAWKNGSIIDSSFPSKDLPNIDENYVGVEPPSDRKEDSIDFPYKFYEKIEDNYQTSKFVSEVLGYQIYRSLCVKSSQLNGNEKLHNCDFFENKEAGNALKELMVSGSSQSWRQVLSTILQNEHSLDAEALLEYYSPVKEWLEHKNKQNGVKIGWNQSK